MYLENTFVDCGIYVVVLKAYSSIYTLVDTYGKCGSIKEAQNIFNALSARDIASWSAMRKGFGINHDGYMAIQCFKCMLKSDLKLDATTFKCNIHCNGGLF